MDRPLSVRATVGVRFPLLVFAVWRLVDGAAVLAFGGGLQKTTFAWDGGWYLSILRSGYVLPPDGYSTQSNAAFFPGLAWLTQGMQFVVRQEIVATLLVANLLALAAFVTVWGAARAWTGEVVARRVTLGLALFPTSFFLWQYYTEALLLAATAAAVWAGRRERHNLAAVFMGVAATARLVGLVAGPALALARIVRLRRVDSVSVRYVAGSLLGLGAVMIRQAVEIGDPFGFLHAGQGWGRQIAGPWTALWHAAGLIHASLPGVAWVTLVDAVAILAVGCLVVLLWRGLRRDAWPLEAPIATTGLWAIPICSNLVASQARYMLACWPALLVVAEAWSRLPRAVRVVLVVLPAVVGILLLRRLSHGLFVG